jgi:exonuclease SbcD
MRVLHTSDWHLGKKLGRHDRSAEQAEVLDEVIEIAEAEAVDLVLVSGDLFDRPFPPIDALRLGLDALQRLSDNGRRPTVAIAGNHDSPELFELLAPLLTARQVHLVGSIKRPQSGGVLEVPTGQGRALVACLPFLREGRVVDFLAEVDSWYGSYADRLARLCQAYDAQLTARAAADPTRSVTLLCAHFMIDGVRLGGHGRVGRGERPLHIGEAYMATSQAVPPGVQYVALGHIHAPQPAPGAAVASEYAGSLLELDFGEAGEKKRVVIVEVEPASPPARGAFR